MISNETLTSWEQAEYVPGELLLAIAEIRRLRKREKEIVEGSMQNVAAHRAVIRELSECLEAFRVGACMDFGRAHALAEHPLVVDVREEK